MPAMLMNWALFAMSHCGVITIPNPKSCADWNAFVRTRDP